MLLAPKNTATKALPIACKHPTLSQMPKLASKYMPDHTLELLSEL